MGAFFTCQSSVIISGVALLLPLGSRGNTSARWMACDQPAVAAWARKVTAAPFLSSAFQGYFFVEPLRRVDASACLKVKARHQSAPHNRSSPRDRLLQPEAAPSGPPRRCDRAATGKRQEVERWCAATGCRTESSRLTSPVRSE